VTANGPAVTRRSRLRPHGTSLRLERVVVSHGWFQTPPFAWDEHAGVLLRRERVGGRAVDLRITESGQSVLVEPSVELTPNEWRVSKQRVRRMLQLDVDLDGFLEATARVDEGLADDLRSVGAGRLLAGASLWEDVVKAICGTNVAWRQAVNMIRRITELERDGTFPEPGRLIEAGEEGLREHARVGYRAPYLVGAARMAADGEISSLDAVATHLPPDELMRRLTSIPGIGPTSARFASYLRGRFDVGLAIDSATVPAAAERWFDGDRPTNDEIAAKVEPAGEWAAAALYWATMRRWQQSL
jgi:3-methyladenine DNA glycosylase/8-oxoguanine DNA glycosylase